MVRTDEVSCVKSARWLNGRAIYDGRRRAQTTSVLWLAAGAVGSGLMEDRRKREGVYRYHYIFGARAPLRGAVRRPVSSLVADVRVAPIQGHRRGSRLRLLWRPANRAQRRV